MSKQKQKGNYFEEKVCQVFREQFEELTHRNCYRSPNSGLGNLEFGDIYFHDYEKYSFVLECKFHNDLSVRSFFPTISKKLISVYGEIIPVKERFIKEYKKVPCLSGVVFSRPYDKKYIMTKVKYDVRSYIANVYEDITYYLYDFEYLLKEVNWCEPNR